MVEQAGLEMAFNRQKFSLKHLLMLIYVLVAVLLVGLLVQEQSRNKPSFTLSHTSVKDAQKDAALSVYGSAFHAGIKGLSAKNVLNEEALLWQLLDGIPVKTIDISGDIALVGFSAANKLLSIRLHDKQKPELMGSIELPADVSQIKIVGEQALVGMRSRAGLALIDMQDPSALKIVRHFPVGGLVTAMVAEGDTVYFADTFNGVGRIDLSAVDPAPEILITMKTPWRLALQGKRLVVASVKGRVLLFDVSQEGELIEAGRLDYHVNVRGVAFVDDTIVVVLADGTMHVLRQTSWPDLQKTAEMKLPGSPIRIDRIPDQTSVAVSIIAGGVVVVDVSRPTKPTITGNLKRADTFFGGKADSETFYGVSRSGLEIFSLDKIVEGAYASLATETIINRDHYKLVSWNNHLYGYRKGRLIDFGKKEPAAKDDAQHFLAVVEENDVGLFTQSEKGQFVRVGSLVTDGTRDVASRGEYLYVLSQNDLSVFSGTQPGELVRVGELELSGVPKSIDLLDSGYLIVITRDLGAVIVDINDPHLPAQVASVASPTHLQSVNIIQDVVADGQRVYMTQGAGGVYVIDMSVPYHPELIQIVDTPGHAKNMLLYDNLLLVADGRKGLFLIDVADRNQALPIGTLPTPITVSELALVDGALIASSHPGGTVKLPLPKRTKSLQIVSENEVLVDVGSIEKGQYLYLYDKQDAWQVKIEM